MLVIEGGTKTEGHREPRVVLDWLIARVLSVRMLHYTTHSHESKQTVLFYRNPLAEESSIVHNMPQHTCITL